MSAVVSEPAAVAEPMAPDLAARVTAFARACKAAARSVALYPGDHPRVASALASVTAAAEAATAQFALPLAVLPYALTVDGRAMPAPDAAVSDLAALLHRHQVGQITVYPQTDADLWRRFLEILALAPDQARERGGLGRLWSSESESRIELRIVDYDEMLRARARGDKATWEAILAGCLEGASFALDDEMVDLLNDVLQDPGKLADLVAAVEARLPDGDAGSQCPAVVASLLQAVVRFVEASAPEQAASILNAVASALTRLPMGVLGRFAEIPRAATRPGTRRFVQDLLLRVPESSVAALVADEVEAGRGLSPELAEVFFDLSPDPAKRARILDLGRTLADERRTADDPALAELWRQTEEKLRLALKAPVVSDAYARELGLVIHRAVELARDPSYAPDQLKAWRSNVSEAQVRLFDANLLSELMSIREDLVAWRDVAALVVRRVNSFVVLGDLTAAALLVENLRMQASNHRVPAVRGAAAEALGDVFTPSTMRHMASHLDTTDEGVAQAARRLCLAIGTAVVVPLAEALSVEERDRRRRHLVEILVAFGPPGREIIERLCQSPAAAVRRTAVLLLKESGGRDVVPELAALLNDAEAHVQREAARALAGLDLDEADRALVAALGRGPDRTRTCLLGALGTAPANEAVRVLSRVLLDLPRRRGLWEVHEQAVERLGSLGGRPAVDALASLLQRRSVMAPFRMAALQRLSVDALARIGTPEARAVLEYTASRGPRGARMAARSRLNTSPAP